MKRIRYIIRAILFVWTILMFGYLNKQTIDTIGRVVEFDNIMDNIKGDSLYMKHNLDLLDNVTTRYTGRILDDSSRVREGILYLMGTLGLFIVIELGFLIADRKKRPTINVK